MPPRFSNGYPERSLKLTVDDTGILIDSVLQPNGVIPWPLDAGGNRFETLEIIVVGDDIHLRTGDDSLLATEVKRFSDVSDDGADRLILNADIIPNFAREKPVHTHLAMRTEAATSTIVVINPGAA